MAYTPRQVVITVKTYPELSTKHTETVCTVALDSATGSPVRLYPVPLRYLDGERQYKLYDEIIVPIAKSSSDPRPESFKVDAQRIQTLRNIPTNGDWRARSELVFRDPSWHYPNMDALLGAYQEKRLSIGMIRPGEVEDVEVTEKAPGEREVFERKSADLRLLKEADLFDPTYKEIAFLTHEVHLLWRCEERCRTCSNQPHRMSVLDWGLLELGRRDGWDKAEARLRAMAEPGKHDFRLYLGNMRLRQQVFVIIGLWYPKTTPQLDLL